MIRIMAFLFFVGIIIIVSNETGLMAWGSILK